MALATVGAKAETARILVVDDDPGMRDLGLVILRTRGYQAEGAEDGLQALARMRQEAFDVVVSDLRMPRLDGFALLREIGRLAPRLPVVIHTSLLEGSLEDRLRRAGAFRVLTKGAPLSDFVRSVEEAYRTSRNIPARCV